MAQPKAAPFPLWSRPPCGNFPVGVPDLTERGRDVTFGASTSLSSIVPAKEAKGRVSTFYCTEVVYTNRAEAGRVVPRLVPE